MTKPNISIEVARIGAAMNSHGCTVAGALDCDVKLTLHHTDSVSYAAIGEMTVPVAGQGLAERFRWSATLEEFVANVCGADVMRRAPMRQEVQAAVYEVCKAWKARQ
jgi:hypothetical protein